jgi:sentrin-specific protease 1
MSSQSPQPDEQIRSVERLRLVYKAAILVPIPANDALQIRNALSPYNRGKAIKSIEQVAVLTGGSFHELVDGLALKNGVINAWMFYLQHGAKQQNSVHGGNWTVGLADPHPFSTMPTYFWSWLENPSSLALQQQCAQRGLFETTILRTYCICIPINFGDNHWALGVVLPKEKQLELYDPRGPCAERLATFEKRVFAWLQGYADWHWHDSVDGERTDYRFSPEGWGKWAGGIRLNDPRDTRDSGVVVCMTAFCMAKFLSQTSLEDLRPEDCRMQIAAVLMNGGFSGEYKWIREAVRS